MLTVGSFSPPSSHFLEVSSISIGELVVVGTVVLLGMVLASVLLVFNIAWRKNKYILFTIRQVYNNL